MPTSRLAHVVDRRVRRPPPWYATLRTLLDGVARGAVGGVVAPRREEVARRGHRAGRVGDTSGTKVVLVVEEHTRHRGRCAGVVGPRRDDPCGGDQGCCCGSARSARKARKAQRDRRPRPDAARRPRPRPVRPARSRRRVRGGGASRTTERLGGLRRVPRAARGTPMSTPVCDPPRAR